MSLLTKKNPASILVQCLGYWWSLRKEANAFSFADAFMNWREVILPSRYAYRTLGERLAKEARIERVEEGVHKVTLAEHGVCFFWLGRISNNLYASIALVFDPR